VTLDKDKIADAAIALLSISMSEDHGLYRAWKGLDWGVLDDLHERGWIGDPKSKAKSVVITEEGRRRALEATARLFSDGPSTGGPMSGERSS
jgi:hypothetical protein